MKKPLADRIADIVREVEQTHRKAGAAMWTYVFVHTLMDLLPTKGAFTHEELRLALEARRDGSKDELVRDACDTALKFLAEHAPR